MRDSFRNRRPFSSPYAMEVVGRIGEIRKRFCFISVERRLKHSASVAIRDAARNEHFANVAQSDDVVSEA